MVWLHFLSKKLGLSELQEGLNMQAMARLPVYNIMP